MWDEGPGGYCGRIPSGCGVAITGDWPNPGAQFSEDYKYNLTTMMRSAQDVLGPDALPLWRYDWRAVEHPYSGNWTYVATDWCAGTKLDVTGNGEHPAANGSSPGMLGWNEPNVPGQCEANRYGGDVEAVSEFVALAREFKKHGKFVVTPAPGGGSDWLDNFLAVCERLNFTEIDFMAFHHYVPCNSGKYGHVNFTKPEMMYDSIMEEVRNHTVILKKYNARGFTMKGIWLSETACAPDGGWGFGNWRMDAADILMTQLLKVVDENPILKAWNWFPYRQFGLLWNDTTYEVTELGRRYFTQCHQERFADSPWTDSDAVVVV